MWLLNTSTFKLHDFYTNERPYAILSHRWGDREITFRDMQAESSHMTLFAGDPTDAKQKIQGCCAQARKDGYDWVWIDSCCIDKSSSSELSEAINSMYQWYREAAVCYVYLADVTVGKEVDGLRFNYDRSKVTSSSWFKRSWTLQELLAPMNVQFFAAYWLYIGSKDELKYEIARDTAIDIGALQGEPLNTYSVAQRMSWAHDRVATRSEDVAYSLLGIFDVNMPLLYGEGRRAFLRLQQEIIRSTDDETIFSWETTEDAGSSALAQHPSYFRTCRGMRYIPSPASEPHTMTNRGLSMRLGMLQRSAGLSLALLNCVHTQQDMPDLLVGLYLRKFKDDTYYRARSASGDYRWIGSRHDLNLSQCSNTRFYVMSYVADVAASEESPPEGLGFKFDSENVFDRLDLDSVRIRHVGVWNSEDGILRVPRDHIGGILNLDFSAQERCIRIIEIGLDEKQDPCCLIFDATHHTFIQHNTTDGVDRRPKNKTSDSKDNRTRTHINTRGLESLRGSTDYRKIGWTLPSKQDGSVRPLGGAFDGLWAIKGRQQDGLQFTITPPTRTSLPRHYMLKLSITRREADDQEWEVIIHDILNPSVKH